MGWNPQIEHGDGASVSFFVTMGTGLVSFYIDEFNTYASFSGPSNLLNIRRGD